MTHFNFECLEWYHNFSRGRILSALREIPVLTEPRTVELNHDVLEDVFGSFGNEHAFNACCPDWGIWLYERQVTRALRHLLDRGTGQLRASRIRSFLEALRIPNLPDDSLLERAEVFTERDMIDLEIRFPYGNTGRVRAVLVEAKLESRLREGQLARYFQLRQGFDRDCRIIGLTPDVAKGLRGPQVNIWPVFLWRDVWLRFEMSRPKEPDDHLATFQAWLWERIGGLNPKKN